MPDRVADDIVQPFQVDPFRLRGRLVRLGPVLDRILTQHDYPAPVAALLGEAIALAISLSGALKYDGVFTLQTKGDGPIRLLVADVTTAGAVRGYAQFDAAKLARLGSEPALSVPRLLGAGYLALTVDQGEHTERYQGIVALEGATLAECVHHYFRQSEQVEAGIKVAVGQRPGPDGRLRWRGGTLMIERLPKDDSAAAAREAEDEGWHRAMVLMATSTADELLDPDLAPEALLFRLFHEDGVRAYRPHALTAQCRCSRERVERMLTALPPRDLIELAVDGKLVVTCEFCNATYSFDEDMVAAMAPP
ncbi:MAG: Hsp33 family molecular chaperone [Alphaproteobacteria bacterium]|nr:Hsp33 family molecular chaperone [Alphaproteobacteria bacterium]